MQWAKEDERLGEARAGDKDEDLGEPFYAGNSLAVRRVADIREVNSFKNERCLLKTSMQVKP